jgi:hypothetical protein
MRLPGFETRSLRQHAGGACDRAARSCAAIIVLRHEASRLQFDLAQEEARR